MSETQEPKTQGTPKHLWVVGIVAILVSSIGAFGFLMTLTKNQWWLSGHSAQKISYFNGFSFWLLALWGISSWGCMLGGVQLLLKKQSAVQVFLVSLVSWVIMTVYNYGFDRGIELMGEPGDLVANSLIFVTCVGLFLYARAMAMRGVLR